MVNPSILLGAIPLASCASALYLPHDGDNAVFTAGHKAPSHVVRQKSHAAAAMQQESDKKMIGERRKKGCSKKMKKHTRMKGNNMAKHHFEEAVHPMHRVRGPVRPAVQPETRGSAFMMQKDTSLLIPDSYIVVLKKGHSVQDSLATLASLSQAAVKNLLVSQGSHPLVKGEDSKGFDLTHIYDKSSFVGYAGKFLPEVVDILAQQPGVAFIEQDSKVHTLEPSEEEQSPWGLARLSHREHLGLGTYNKYLYDADAGKGVTCYIVDTGIYTDHEDFEGRAVWGKTMPVGDSDIDAHGHGSHCAGTIGGKKYGVAKKAKLVAVKVLGSDGSGSMSDVIGGIEYVVESHGAEQKKMGSKYKGSTANMSLGGGKSPALDLAVNAATEAGVHFAVAAGNENQDACNTSPAGAEGAITVGATSINDDRAYFSNYGKCVDIFAPGVNVQSVGTYSPSSEAIMSGTSMASPHVAGLLTYFVSLQPSTDSQYSTRGNISTRELKKFLIDFGTSNAINDLDSDSPNIIAYNGGGKDISKLWQNRVEEPEDDDEDESERREKPSFFNKIEEIFEDVVEGIEKSVENFF